MVATEKARLFKLNLKVINLSHKNHINNYVSVCLYVCVISYTILQSKIFHVIIRSCIFDHQNIVSPHALWRISRIKTDSTIKML